MQSKNWIEVISLYQKKDYLKLQYEIEKKKYVGGEHGRVKN